MAAQAPRGKFSGLTERQLLSFLADPAYGVQSEQQLAMGRANTLSSVRNAARGYSGTMQRHDSRTLSLSAIFGLRPVLRLFPPHAPSPHAQGSSGVIATVLLVWRGHTKSTTARSGPGPNLAVWLE